MPAGWKFRISYTYIFFSVFSSIDELGFSFQRSFFGSVLGFGFGFG